MKLKRKDWNNMDLTSHLNITDNLLRAIGFNSKNGIFKQYLRETKYKYVKYYLPSINEYYYKRLSYVFVTKSRLIAQIFILNNRYKDEQDKNLSYNSITEIINSTLREDFYKFDIRDIIQLEKDAKKELAQDLLKGWFIIWFKEQCLNNSLLSENYTKNLFAILEPSNIKINNYNDYYELKQNHKIKKEEISKLEEFWNSVGITSIAKYVYPTFPTKTSDLTTKDLKLSNRALNTIKGYNLTIDELLFFTREDLMNIRTVGIKNCNEIIEKLHDMGLYLFEESKKLPQALNYSSKEDSFSTYYKMIQEKDELEEKLKILNQKIDSYVIKNPECFLPINNLDLILKKKK